MSPEGQKESGNRDNCAKWKYRGIEYGVGDIIEYKAEPGVDIKIALLEVGVYCKLGKSEFVDCIRR